MKDITQYRLVTAEGSTKDEVISLVQQNELPVSDLDDTKILFAVLDNSTVVGAGGLELFKDCALVRSISVAKEFQGKGLGKFITSELEKVCREKGVATAYLLTTTAKDFFIKQKYHVVDRKNAPPSIKNTSEFSTVCSSSAILMKKDIL